MKRVSPATCQCLAERPETFDLKRLLQVAVKATQNRPTERHRCEVSCRRHDWAAGVKRAVADQAQYLEAIDPVQVQVKHDKVWPMALQVVKGALGVFDNGDLAAVTGGYKGKDVLGVPIVVNQKHCESGHDLTCQFGSD